MNIVIGDSNSGNLKIINGENFVCGGGTAKGLNNPNSISQYHKKIINKVNENNYKNLIFLFGSVDVDFSFIHKYIENPKINYEVFNSEVVKNYLQFITNNFSDKSVIILSVGLPNLDDDNLKRGLLNGHISYLENQNISELEKKMSNINLPNITERTKIALNINEQLKKEIIKLQKPNIKFLDITSFTYDDNIKQMKEIYFKRTDHHFNFPHLWNDIINKFLNSESLL